MTQKGKPKSRVGCSACKSRRVKCDESKPECLECTKKGRRCPGYQRNLKWSTKHELGTDIKTAGPVDLQDLLQATSQSLKKHFSNSGHHGQGVLQTYTWPSPEATITGCPTSPTHTVPHQSYGSPKDAGILQPAIEYTQSVVSYVADDQYEDDQELSEWLENSWPDYPQGQYSSLVTDPQECTVTTISPNSESLMTAASLDLTVTPNPARKTSAVLDYSHHLNIGQSLTDLPTFLIDYWFENVCSLWSGFDSSMNLNRTFASADFASSESLFYSLQSMAAAFLASRLPYLKTTAMKTAKRAVHAIKCDLNRVYRSSTLDSFPRDLLLSLCCLGTSGCWTDARQLGLTFLRETKKLLYSFNEQSFNLSADDLSALSFFNNSCLYWNMLCRVAASSGDEMLPNTSHTNNVRLPAQNTLHPWTGTSATILELFTETITVCKRFRSRMKQSTSLSLLSLQAALQDVRRAQELEDRLKTLPRFACSQEPETRDVYTPASHLVNVAEGYRLASLLQLRQTFPDLLGQQASAARYINADSEIRALALAMVKIMQQIPLSSRTHCIQPLLYLSASTGLRFDVSVPVTQPSSSEIDEIFSPDLSSMSTDMIVELDTGIVTNDTPVITATSVEVSHARQFVLERLCVLERKLPPKPVEVVKELVQRIWDAYDNDELGLVRTHWIDLMEETGLWTMFG